MCKKTGLELLIRVWRGEDIPWQEIEREHMPTKICPGCECLVYKHEYNNGEWNKPDKRGNCQRCLRKRIAEGTPFECNVCYTWLPETSYLPLRANDQIDLTAQQRMHLSHWLLAIQLYVYKYSAVHLNLE